jgi:hypothetical protein
MFNTRRTSLTMARISIACCCLVSNTFATVLTLYIFMRSNPAITLCLAAALVLSAFGSTPTRYATAASATLPALNCGLQSEQTSGSGSLKGRLVDAATLQPLANARVALCITDSPTWPGNGTHLVTTTSADGGFVFDNLPAAQNCPVAGACTYNTFRVIPLVTDVRADYEMSETVWDGKEPALPDILVRKGANISGSINDFVAGHAVDNIMILAHRKNPNGPAAPDDPQLMTRLMGAVYTATVSAAGVYTLTNLPTGAFDLYALPLTLNYSSDVLANVQAQTPYTTAGVNFALKRTARVFGRVRNSRGDAVPNISMRLLSNEAGEAPSDAWSSGVGGTFDFRARGRQQPQRIIISGTYPYLGQIVEQTITFSIGSSTEFTLTVYEPGLIRGTVRHRSGKAALNQQVNLIDSDNRFANGTPGCSPSGLTDGNGNFTLCGIHPASTYLIATLQQPPGTCTGPCTPLQSGYYGGSQRSLALPITVQERQITAGIAITIPDPVYLPMLGAGQLVTTTTVITD